MLEFYEAYSDFENLVELTESLISDLSSKFAVKASSIRRAPDRLHPALATLHHAREAVIHYWPADDGIAKPRIEDLSTP